MRPPFHAFGWALCASLALIRTAVSAAPTVARVTTPAGAPATTVAPSDELLIQGAGFGSASGEVWLDRGGYGREAQVLAWNGTDGSIRIRIPAQADPGSLGLIVRAGDQESTPFPFRLAAGGAQPAVSAPASPAASPAALPPATPAAPEIRGINLLGGGPITSGIAGTRVLLSGARLGSRGELRFNGTLAAAVTVWNPTYLVAMLPKAPGTGSITVRRIPGLPDDATGAGLSFTILPPVINEYMRGSVVTARAHPGDVIAIRGTNLGSGGQVLVLGNVATVQNWTPGEIDVVVPPVQGTGPVRITLNPRTGAEVSALGPDLTVAITN